MEARAAAARAIGRRALDRPEAARDSENSPETSSKEGGKAAPASLLQEVMAARQAPPPSRDGRAEVAEGGVAAAVMEGLLRAGQARSKRPGVEHTWERVVTAERLRARLAAEAAPPSMQWLRAYAEFHRS